MKRSNGASYRASRPAAWGVFWGEADLKPHLVRPWKHNERAAEPEIFDREVRQSLRMLRWAMHCACMKKVCICSQPTRRPPSRP